MSKLPGSFDASKVDPRPMFDTLPEGDYPVMITDSEMIKTKAGDGEYLNLTLEVIDGPAKGRIVFDRLNLINSNAKAVEIAQRALSQICHAIGVLRVDDSAELHNRPLIVRLGIEAGKPKADGGKYEDKNKIKSYKPIGSGVQAAPAVTAAAAPVAAPAKSAPVGGGNPPPWAKPAKAG